MNNQQNEKPRASCVAYTVTTSKKPAIVEELSAGLLNNANKSAWGLTCVEGRQCGNAFDFRKSIVLSATQLRLVLKHYL